MQREFKLITQCIYIKKKKMIFSKGEKKDQIKYLDLQKGGENVDWLQSSDDLEANK